MYLWFFTTGLRHCINTEDRADYDDTPMNNLTCERGNSHSRILKYCPKIHLQDVRKNQEQFIDSR